MSAADSAADKLAFLESLPKHYAPAQVEPRWAERWEASGLFHAEPDDRPGAAKPFTIVIPPPNVTGILHMGHALNNTLQDILVRFQRMRGRNALWMPGTDHAGIATQNVVEKALAQEGAHREALGRDAFVERVWQWKDRHGRRIVEQLKRLGCSCDWARERFTMDEGLSRAVREVFVRLHNEGLVYRGRRLINWCPRCRTALADDEIEHQENKGKLWHIRYPLKNRSGALVVATTRPETMLGDAAVAVHPADPRYRDLVGETVVLPILGREIPVVADDMVDRDFGTGVVKVTPAHDPNDYECGLRHNLPQITVIGPDGLMTAEAGKFAGLDRFRCRARLVEELDEKRLLEKVEDHVNNVGQCYRCDSVVEPFLSEQWFVRMRPLADAAIAASREGKVKFWPARWERVYLSWLENVRDWCISRQIWWGHRIPVWYCKDCGQASAAAVDPDACPKCGGRRLEQDPDVLDTWFSSALWPFSTLGWPDKTPELAFYYPTDVLVTARDIIYFWVARMVMMGLHFMKEVPFRHVYINGTILDEHGARMSKSRENGIDPIVLIEGGVQRRFGKDFRYEGYGADAVRYTLCSLTTDGQDLRLSPNRFEAGRNFTNKLWNATRFALLKLASLPEPAGAVDVAALDFEERWILSRLSATLAAATEALEHFRFHEYAQAVHEFAWGDFCDWYLEMAKPRLAPDHPAAPAVGRVLALALDHLLRLIAPAMPFFAEEAWSLLARFAPKRGLSEARVQPELVAGAPWPAPDRHGRARPGLDALPADPALDAEMRRVQDAVRAIRNVRAKFNLPPKAELRAVASCAQPELAAVFAAREAIIRSQSGAAELAVGHGLSKPAQAATEMLDGAQLYVPLAGLMDVAVEAKRIAKEREKKSQQLAGLNAKLRNNDFLAKAPADVIARGEAQREELTRQIGELEELARSLEEA